MTDKHRSRTQVDKVIALSISWQHENLLARGLGLEHLLDLLLKIARPILRTGASLAYAGNWIEGEGNFTYELLRLISMEQEDSSLAEPNNTSQVGLLYNHSAWPHYLNITPRIEAQWINCCRIVRITQQMAGIAECDIVPDNEAKSDSSKVKFNAAVTSSQMRRLMMAPMSISIPDAPDLTIPPVEARIVLGGKISDFSGFMPGLFEEALVTLQHQKPVFILGGFGGAAQVLANAILKPKGETPPEMLIGWHRENNPEFDKFLQETKDSFFPVGLQKPENAFKELTDLLDSAN